MALRDEERARVVAVRARRSSTPLNGTAVPGNSYNYTQPSVGFLSSQGPPSRAKLERP